MPPTTPTTLTPTPTRRKNRHLSRRRPLATASSRAPGAAAGRWRKRVGAAVVSVAPRASKRQRVMTEKAADAQLTHNRGSAFG
jgi:hypothetical protein